MPTAQLDSSRIVEPTEAVRPLRILLLILQFPPDVNSTGLLLSRLCERLGERGHQITVFTSFPHYAEFRVRDEYRGKLAEWEHVDDRLSVLRLWVRARGPKGRMLNRFLSYASFNALAALAGLFSRRRFDVILATNGGFFSGITAALVGTVRRIPFVLNIQDLYPETPIRAGQIRSRTAIAVLRFFERFMYARARALAVITPSFRDVLAEGGVPEPKIRVIPNFVDTNFIRPLPRENSFSTEHGLDGKFVVSHAGNVGYVYDLETLLDAAAMLRERRDIVFLIVGDGVMKPRLQERGRALGLDNVRFLPFQPVEKLPLLRASSDVQVSLYRRGSSAGSMPSKIYEIMASGRPLLASAEQGTDPARLVEETGCGLCVPPEDATALADAVLRLHADEPRRTAMGAAGRRYAEERYSLPVVADQYHDLLQGLAKKGRRAHEPIDGRAGSSSQ